MQNGKFLNPYCKRYYQPRSRLDRLTGQSEISSMEFSINWKMGAIGKTYLKTSPLIPPSIGTCIQWRAAGVFEELMSVLHRQVREQVKKNRTGRHWSSLTPKRWKIPAMPVWSRKVFVSTKPPTALKGIWLLTPLDFPSLRTVLVPMSRMMPD